MIINERKLNESEVDLSKIKVGSTPWIYGGSNGIDLVLTDTPIRKFFDRKTNIDKLSRELGYPIEFSGFSDKLRVDIGNKRFKDARNDIINKLSKIKLNESTSFKSGDKIKFRHPATLDQWISGTINREANGREINKYYDHPMNDKYYLIDLVYNGKKDKIVIASSDIKKSMNESAKDAIILDKNSKHVVASQIALNLQGEWDAIDGYNKLIPWFEKYNDQDAIDQIREVISDELNHAEKLREIMKRYDGNILTNKD